MIHDNFVPLYLALEKRKEIKFDVETCKKVSVEIHQRYLNNIF